MKSGCDILLIDEEFSPILITEECEKVKPIIKDFIEYYARNKDKPVEEWLVRKMQELLPDEKSEKIQKIVEEIITTIRIDEGKKESLRKATENGRSKDSWFASEIQKATSGMTVQESVNYLAELDYTLQEANKSLYRTITTQSGQISQNPSLDGFIAEQYHAQTFNLNAEAKGSPYRAKVLEPEASKYVKNSVDIVIMDAKGNIVKRYQSKYYKSAKATEQAFERGDYRGQQKLVPEGQEKLMQKKANAVIEAPDGTTSNPLTKSKAEQMRDEAQSGKWNDLNWNEYAVKDIAKGIGKQAGYAALQGVAIGVGFDVAQKLWNGDDIEVKAVVEKALVNGTDFGVKVAAAGALKVGVEKEIITVIPKGTPAGTLANIAFVAIEDIKVAGKIVSGELSVREGIEEIEQTTVAVTAGLVTMGKGAAIGAVIGGCFGPVGATVGGFLGGTIGYMAGSNIGENAVKGIQKLRNQAVKLIKEIERKVESVGHTVTKGMKNRLSDFVSFLGI